MMTHGSPDPGKGHRHSARAAIQHTWRRARGFRRAEDGGLVVFSLFILLCMMLAVGVAIDTARFEYVRAELQSTQDRAVLAAADLDQVLPPKEVVEDYFDRAGLREKLISVQVDQGINYRNVSAVAKAEIDTMFMDMVGINKLIVPAEAAANESLADIEIALVLDNSGSMGENNNLRLNLLKPAAREFIDTVARGDTDEGTTAISIVPFATQVTVGKTLLDEYNATDEHGFSHCVTFDSDDFTKPSITRSEELKRTAHFDPYGSGWYLNSRYQVCENMSSREITPWSTDADYLKSRINAMQAKGWTSIELGTKWGLAMLDPQSQPVLTSLADKGLVDGELRGQPFAYDRDKTVKILVVMSDGANTKQWDVKEPYREGNSPVYRYKYNGNYYYSYYRNRSSTSYDYYSVYHRQWRKEPVGGDNAVRMTWPDVWEDMSVKRYAYDIQSRALGGNWQTHYNNIVDSFSSSLKNTRTSQICQAAKDKGVLVFTIGMDTYGQGDATLSDCASLPTYFYDVRAVDISTAFNSIALQINQLRLTH